MVYNIGNCFAFGFCPSSGTLKSTKKHVSETDPASEMLCSLVLFRIPDDGQSPKTQ
jgi:hypothetical protein